MTRKEQRNRMPSVNVNDGKPRLIITLQKDMRGIESVGRYGIDPIMATSVLVDALPVVRSEELKYVDERWESVVQNVAALTPAPNAEPGVPDGSDSDAEPQVDVSPEA